MRLGKKRLAALFGAALFAVPSALTNAGTYKSFLEYSAVADFGGDLTSNTPPYFGEVTSTEGGLGKEAYVNVHVDHFKGFNFIDSGNDAIHTSFASNLTAAGLAHLVNIAPSPPFTITATNPSNKSASGDFTTGLDCCDKNGAPGLSGPLDFRVTSENGITFFGVSGHFNNANDYRIGSGDRFASNTTGVFSPFTGGWLFLADLVGLGGSSNGPVAARDSVGSIPEPATYTILLSALGIMWFMQRGQDGHRRKRISHPLL